MRKRIILVLSMIMLLSVFSQVSAQLNDIGGHWAEKEIRYLVNKNIVQGSNNRFRPDDTITRAEFVTMINRAKNFTKVGQVSFPDVKSGVWYYEDVSRAVAAGYIKGYPNGNFGPGNEINRADSATIIGRVFNFEEINNPPGRFTDDNSIRAYAKGFVYALAEKEYIKGYREYNTFRPLASITRAEAATMLAKTLQGEQASKPAPKPQPPVSTPKVDITGVKYLGDNKIEITSTGKIDYESLFWNNKLIIDIKDAKLSNLGGSVKAHDSDNIRDIRYSQYSLDPMTTRVVVDLTGKYNFENSNGSTKTIISIENDKEATKPVEPPKTPEPVPSPKPSKPGQATVVIDPGHGGSDPGAVGNGLLEKDISLSVSLKLGKVLENKGFNVIYTRKTDVYPSLSERTAIANRANADVFVSIHTNAFNSAALGYETYSYPTSTEGGKLAKDIHDSVIANKDLYNANRGAKKDNFQVIRETNMPAVLLELGFIDNSKDAKILVEKQDEFAQAISKGILNYLDM